MRFNKIVRWYQMIQMISDSDFRFDGFSGVLLGVPRSRRKTKDLEELVAKAETPQKWLGMKIMKHEEWGERGERAETPWDISDSLYLPSSPQILVILVSLDTVFVFQTFVSCRASLLSNGQRIAHLSEHCQILTAGCCSCATIWRRSGRMCGPGQRLKWLKATQAPKDTSSYRLHHKSSIIFHNFPISSSFVFSVWVTGTFNGFCFGWDKKM